MAENSANIAAELLVATGFQTVGHNNLLAKLCSIVPNGRTAMRDSLLAGISMILKLNQCLQQLGLAENWNFVHILITDGQDTASKASLQEAAGAMLAVGQRIPVSRCKTLIIGIDLGEDRKATAELLALRQFGGENCQIFEIGAVNIDELFNRIQVNLGVMRETSVGVAQSPTGQRAVVIAQREQAVVQVSRTSFAVVFNIDISGSMQENGRYERVKRSVAQFLAKSPEDDLVAGICFNESVMLLGQMQARGPPALANQQSSAGSSQQQYYQNQSSGQCCCSLF